MTTRDKELERLRIASPCRSSWEDMRGDARRRYCAECERYVYDFAQLTAREAAGLVEATGGALCARLTRDGAGRLVTLEPPAAAEPVGARRAAPLAAAAVAAVLGLSGAVSAHAAVTAPPTAEQGTGERPAESPPQRMEGAGGSLAATLATDGGEPIPRAEVTIYNRLDGRERAGRTDEQGKFSFASLPAGIYVLAASFERYHLVQKEVLLRAGEMGRIELTVPADTWRSAVSGTQETITVGGAVLEPENPIHNLYAGAGLVVFGVAGQSVVARGEEYTWEVRTDLVLSSVVKGETRERVISVFHQQMADEDPASRLQPGDRVLAFLDPREAPNGRGWDGYAVHTAAGFRKLSEAEAAAYGRRLTALARIARRGTPRPADLVEWLVATAEDPVTRGEAVGELDMAVAQLRQRAEKRGAPTARYAQGLRDMLADFLKASDGQKPVEDRAVLAAFLTDAQRERLTAALLRTTHLGQAEMNLYELVGWWHDDRTLPWLIGRIRAGEPSGRIVLEALFAVAKDLGDKGLDDLVSASLDSLSPIEGKLAETDDEAARQRLLAAQRAAEEDLRRRFLAAVGRRPAA